MASLREMFIPIYIPTMLKVNVVQGPQVFAYLKRT